MRTIHFRWQWLLGAVLLIMAIMILSSCTTTKEVRKERRKTRLEEKLLEKTKTRSETTTTTDTRTVTETRITETVDTMIVIPEKRISGSISEKDLLQGEHLIVEAEGTSLEVFRDSVNGLIRALSVSIQSKIPVHITKVTEQRANSSTREKSQTKAASDSAKRKKLEAEKADLKTEKLASYMSLPWYIWVIIIFLVLLIIGFSIKRFFW